jgi:hypothetical protein
MEALRQTQKKYCGRALICAVVISLMFIIAGEKPLGKGLVLGAVFSIVNFIIMGETLPMRIGRSKRNIFFISLGSIFFRYFLLAVPIVLAVKLAQFSLASAVVGIFMVQLVILADHLFIHIFPLRRRQS